MSVTNMVKNELWIVQGEVPVELVAQISPHADLEKMGEDNWLLPIDATFKVLRNIVCLALIGRKKIGTKTYQVFSFRDLFIAIDYKNANKLTMR